MSKLIEVAVAGRTAPVADRTAIGVFESIQPEISKLRSEVRTALGRLSARRGWKGRAGQVSETQLGAGRALSLFGLGAADSLTWRSFATFLEATIAAAVSAGDTHLVIVLPDHPVARGERASSRVARIAALGAYRFDRFLAKRTRLRLRRVTLLPPPGDGAAYRRGVEIGAAVAAGVALARDLANTPPNEATPSWMASRARDLARRHKARIQVLGPAELRRRGMGGILAVGGGSANPPRLVKIELGRGPRTVALVGKGVTFDTGGISIKPAAQMDEMKWDKCGACSVLGILEAMARLGPGVKLKAYVPLAENMPDGAAYRPGDIVRCGNGKTVEILNTDAEGRMILADALSWAASEKPDHLIEFSTLTGACVVALGQTGAGLFSPDDDLSGSLLEHADGAGERLWRLPLWEEFLESMRGTHADLKNSGGRWGGASTAAAFLSQFVEEKSSWAHVDIAGPAYQGESKETRGATGYGVAFTVSWLRSLSGASPS